MAGPLYCFKLWMTLEDSMWMMPQIGTFIPFRMEVAFTSVFVMCILFVFRLGIQNHKQSCVCKG